MRLEILTLKSLPNSPFNSYYQYNMTRFDEDLITLYLIRLLKSNTITFFSKNSLVVYFRFQMDFIAFQ